MVAWPSLPSGDLMNLINARLERNGAVKFAFVGSESLPIVQAVSQMSLRRYVD